VADNFVRRNAVVLMADDDDDDLLLVRDALDQDGLKVDFRTVPDGHELMDYLNNRGKYADPESAPSPSLILLDLNMPRKDGREVLSEIRSDPRFKSIPIVVLTTSKEEIEIARCYELGSNSYIVKPVSYEELVDTMHALVQYWFKTVLLPSDQS
jgi:two-component system, response regulator